MNFRHYMKEEAVSYLFFNVIPLWRAALTLKFGNKSFCFEVVTYILNVLVLAALNNLSLAPQT